MKRFGPPGKAEGAEYDIGDPELGREADRLMPDAFDPSQKELDHLIAESGQTPSASDLTQVVKAVRKISLSNSASDIAFMAGLGGDGSGEDLKVQTYSFLVAASDITIFGVSGYIDAASVGASVVVDVLKNDVSIFQTKPSFQSGQKTLTSGSFVGSASTINASAGDRLEFKIIQIGSTVAGQKLGITLKARGR